MEASSAAKIAEIVLTMLAPAVTVLAVFGARKLIKVFEAKSGVDLPLKQEQRIEEWVEKAIAYAEEKAHKAAKAKLAKVTGPEKLELAAGYVIDMIDQAGWDDALKTKVKERIEAALNMKRS